MINPPCLLSLIFVSLCGTALMASEQGGGNAPAAERALVVENAEKLQVRHSMIGFTHTRIFYTFAAQRVVLVVNIDNETADFKTSGSLVIFAPDADAESIAKWVNNAHSDGIFVDPAEPTAIHQLPGGLGTVTKREITGEEKHPMTKEPYSDYKVRISIKEHHVEGEYKLHAFEDDANVFLKTGTL